MDEQSAEQMDTLSAFTEHLLSTRHCAKSFTCTDSFSLPVGPKSRNYYDSIEEEETGAQGLK